MKLHQTVAILMFSVLMAGATAAQMKQADAFELVVAPVGAKNPRNSEAAIIQRKDGSLLLAWTEFYAGQGADHGPARIAGKLSQDGGRTWSEKFTLIENDGGCNVMEVNFLRLHNGDVALFHCQKNTQSSDCRIMMRTSADDGKTWSAAKQLSPAGKYTGLTNGRCIRLRTGRILLEAWEGGDSYCVLSDDDGKTWHDSQRVQPAKGKCYEPACIELSDGRVMMLMRTGLGCQYKSLSKDGGQTWSEPVPTPLAGTAAPVAISRVPTTGDLLAIWNHNPGAKKRNPLTAAISKDEGATWTSSRNLEDMPPDDAWAYPAVTWVGDRALITYFNYKGGLSLKLRSLPANWFYQRNDRVTTAEQVGSDRLRAEFLKMCDASCPVVREQARRMERKGRAFFWDSYTVRGLCVAYDMTGKAEYLEASKVWSDGMVEFQKGMIPKGTYYMQYYRKPGESEGNWYVADTSSIALGVLATAIRCREPEVKKKLLGSVQAFARLVAENWVRPSGGVANGFWPKSDKEWWCSSGIFGSLAFHLYTETGERSYLQIGLGTLDWLNQQDLLGQTDYPLPTVLMYSLEAYSAGLPHLESGTPCHRATMAQLAKLNEWMTANSGGRAGMSYATQWGSKCGGLPFHLYVQARFTNNPRLEQIADIELGYVATMLRELPASNQRDQLGLFAMMSYAEKLSPGTIYRTTKRPARSGKGTP